MANMAARLLAVLIGIHANLVAAQVLTMAHYNAVELQRESATSVQFAFSLNLPQTLHPLLAPQLTLPGFLQRYADLPDAALEKELAKASAALSDKAYFTLPSGAKTTMTQWQWPDKQSVRDVFRTSLVLLKMPPDANAHLDPMRVLARARAKSPISRAQLQLPAVLYPIEVSLPRDKFWLTEQIPMAIVELP